MAKITVKAGYGNAPRKLFLKDFNIAFAKGDIDFMTTNLADDVEGECPVHPN
jgi:hypothetical protein